ncbi:hypothetical protein FSP39_013331 [Pinctada imbricata]|uniref:RNA helicase n=1 Tax=Pinctada imbricata TaxID=66713 RepID=A0AA88Y0D4_PINIB|nr:hypothetical protein FSP39_013331 [Pinctada imbricata]
MSLTETKVTEGYSDKTPETRSHEGNAPPHGEKKGDPIDWSADNTELDPQTEDQYGSNFKNVQQDGNTEVKEEYGEAQEFDQMGLADELLKGIYAYGYEKPSMIQQKAIPQCLTGRDVIAQAQSGTGKTATFSVGVLQRLDIEDKRCQALILAPTRELAIQTHRVVTALGDYMGVVCHAFVGGRRVSEDVAMIRRGIHVGIATPGRMMHLLGKKFIDPESIRMFVMDEADEMLSKGFLDQIYDLFQFLPREIQVILVSATMPREIMDITSRFMNNPVKILVKNEELTLSGIHQFYVNVEREDWKFETLCDLYEAISIKQSVIFCNSRRKVEWLTQALDDRDFTVSSVHGDMSQDTRETIMHGFRTGSSRVLITTDLLARGIDVQQVSLVLNYDLPIDRESYIHRIGRGGRFGRKGVAINFVTNDNLRQLRELEQFYNTQIEEMPRNIADVIEPY